MNITSLDHVGINATDLQRSADWYRRVLGFESVHKWTKTWMVGCGSMRIGLFLRPTAIPVDDLDNCLAITHFAFFTDADGFAKAQDELRALCVRGELQTRATSSGEQQCNSTISIISRSA